MRPPKTITALALVLLLFHTTGCYSFQATANPLPSGAPDPEYFGKEYRITLKDGDVVTLGQVGGDSVTVTGFSVAEKRTVELQRMEVLSVEEKVFSGIKTFGVAVLIGIPILIAAASAESSRSRGDGWFGGL